MTPLGMVVAALTSRWALSRFGGLVLANVSLVASAACLLAIKAVPVPLLWLPLRFLIGAFVAWIFIITETWINQMAPDRLRGRIVGLYSTALAIGFGVGPAILLLVGTRGWAPFVLGAGCTLVGVVPLLTARARLPRPRRREAVRLRAFARAAPLLLVCVGAAALADQTTMALLPVFGLRSGLSEHETTLLLVAMIAGAVGLLYPVGWLADRLPFRFAAAGCAATTAALAALLPLATSEHFLLWPLMFLWGGAYYGVYVLALIALGNRFTGDSLVAGNAAFGVTWGLAGLLGPVAIGGAMSGVGPVGLPASLAALFLAVALAVALS